MNFTEYICTWDLETPFSSQHTILHMWWYAILFVTSLYGSYIYLIVTVAEQEIKYHMNRHFFGAVRASRSSFPFTKLGVRLQLLCVFRSEFIPLSSSYLSLLWSLSTLYLIKLSLVHVIIYRLSLVSWKFCTHIRSGSNDRASVINVVRK